MTQSEIEHITAMLPKTGLGLAVTILLTLVTSSGGKAVFEFWKTRTGRKAEAARQHAEAEREGASSDLVRAQWLFESQAAIHKVDREAAQKRYDLLEDDCDRERKSHRALRRSVITLVGAVELVLVRFRPAHDEDTTVAAVHVGEYLQIRDAVTTVREKLN